jgi:predicted DNA-binding ribbon-helix-helix protein
MLVTRNIITERGRSSMRLEPPMWDMLCELCEREGRDMSDLIRQISPGDEPGRTSAVRVFIARYFHDAATDEGHELAGHMLGSVVPIPKVGRRSTMSKAA